MKDEHEYIKIDTREYFIHVIRGQQVMLDSDLAKIYGYELKRLNEQVKRNSERFPKDFMFQLEPEEIPECLKSQIATLNDIGNKRGQHIKKMPYVFTEQGTYMLASVLKGDIAVTQSIAIMRAFKNMRHFLTENQQFVRQDEFNQLSVTVQGNQGKITALEKKVDELNNNFLVGTERKELVIYKGQRFEADVLYIQIYAEAKNTILVVDNYVNYKTLELLKHKQNSVTVTLCTNNLGKGKQLLTNAEVADFNAQYPLLIVKPNAETHDRLIVLDYNTTHEKIFHCGASSKDAGKKVCAINEISDVRAYRSIIETLLSADDFLCNQ